MSKSKLNRRQLKKISKIASIAIQKYWRYKPDDFYIDSNGYGWLCYKATWACDYDEVPVFDEIFKCFDNEWGFKYGVDTPCSPCFENLSFVNKIHYMIKFLEVGNEN